MAKFGAGKLSLEEHPFSPQECIRQAVEFLAPEARRKGLDIAFSVDREVPACVLGDQMRLRQIFINLIGNAVKFTDRGKVLVRAGAAKADTEGKRELSFSISDTGIGIPDDKKELLFQAFSQVDPSLSRRFGGTGLGLAISREIVEMMGGSISFQSDEGKGTVFSFTIRLPEAASEQHCLPAAKPGSYAGSTSLADGEKIPRLLLAEDDWTIRQVLGGMLNRFDYQLDFAEDGLKAVEMWEKGGYDLVLMDIQMPRLNGFEVTRIIREQERERGGHIPVIAMTAHASREDEEMCHEAGMDAYISKPIDFRICLRQIEELLRNG